MKKGAPLLSTSQVTSVCCVLAMEVCLHTFLTAVRQGLEGAAARDGEEVRGKGEGRGWEV